MKNYLLAIVGLAVMLIVMNFIFKLGKKAPIVGGAVEKVEDLVHGE